MTNFANLSEFKNVATAKRECGVSYLGGCNTSSKIAKGTHYTIVTDTFVLYLAPSDMSGYKVCPADAHCREFCLFGSGRNKIDILANGFEGSTINRARIAKTKLFFENRPYFMSWLVSEIRTAKAKAEKSGHEFAVRLNGTSDISISDFVLNGVCICDIFPDVQFYDYTKVPAYFKNIEKYANYDITYSFNGYNEKSAERALANGIRVAVVFESDKFPKTFMGADVVNGDLYDMRFYDPKGCIVGLKLKKTASMYVDGKFTLPDTKFIVKETDPRSVY